MKFPYLGWRQQPGRLSRRDERVFAEAKVLAMLRLEQCLADLRIPFPLTAHATWRDEFHPLPESTPQYRHNTV
jgi:hypothetical protein